VSVDGNAGPVGREPASYTVAGLMASAALFAGVLAIGFHPGRIGPGAILVALVASAIGGPHRRLAAAALAVSSVSWVIGMILAVVLSRPIF
jgi:hypothetical protein